jgi:hypothetical protein
MFGNTYPMATVRKTFGDGIGDGPLAEYIRWEYRPGERAGVLAALRREGTSPPFRRSSRGWARRFASWLRSEAAPTAIRSVERPHAVRRPLRAAGRFEGGSPRLAVP